MNKNLVSMMQTLKSLALAVLLVAGVSYAWTGPTQTAPNGNVAAPINVGNAAQTKTGALTVGGLISTNGLTVGNGSGGATHAYLVMKDDESANGVKYVHANSNVVGFLGGNGTWLSYWNSNGDQQNMGSITANGNVSLDGYVYTHANNWALIARNAQWNDNAAARSSVGSIYVNDVYSRAAGKWMSEVSSGGGRSAGSLYSCPQAGRYNSGCTGQLQLNDSVCEADMTYGARTNTNCTYIGQVLIQ